MSNRPVKCQIPCEYSQMVSVISRSSVVNYFTHMIHKDGGVDVCLWSYASICRANSSGQPRPVNGKRRDYLQDKKRGDGGAGSMHGRPLYAIHIDTALNNHPAPALQLNTCAYVTNSLKSSILNLYDWCPRKLHHKYISLGRLAGGLDTAFIKRHPNLWTWKKEVRMNETSLVKLDLFTRDYYDMTIKKPI